MKARNSRLPKGYDGTGATNSSLSDLLARALERLSQHRGAEPAAVLAAWPEIVGPQYAALARAVSFVDGVLTVKVANATCYSLLCQYEKGKILGRLRQRFPASSIKNVLFRMG